MPGSMTLNIDRQRQTGNMARQHFNMNRKAGHPASKTLGTNSKIINLLQQFFFQLV